MTKFILKIKGVINMSKPKIPMIVISVFLLINAVPMIMIPVAFDKDYIEDNMKSPSTEEGKVYEGLAAHNKAGLGAAFAALAVCARIESRARFILLLTPMYGVHPTFMWYGT